MLVEKEVSAEEILRKTTFYGRYMEKDEARYFLFTEDSRQSLTKTIVDFLIRTSTESVTKKMRGYSLGIG